MVGNDQLLVKIAIFGITMSLLCTAMLSTLFVNNGTGDYDYDTISDYRTDLVTFSGQSMLNQNPWVLTAVYTPWTSADVPVTEHMDPDGWLYGQKIEGYSQIGKSADIRLDSNQKSETPLNIKDPVTTTVVSGSWVLDYTGTSIGVPIAWMLNKVGVDTNKYSDVTANNWNYTGYRYTFDPTLPFSTGTSTVDGTLSIVWYDFNGAEGLSGGLDVYGGNVALASYSATDIISDYNTSSGLATTYDFDFEGTNLTLSIRFDQEAIESGESLMAAWSAGHWSMAISSVSAGNFFDIEKSASFATTAGSMINTFVQIYTLNLPSIHNAWMDVVLWLLVGLPMTIAMLCVTLRLVEAAKPI